MFYASGPDAAALAALAGHGLAMEALDAPVGAASALKVAYAGVTKGTTALAAAMALAAIRSGAAAELRRELAGSQAGLLSRFERSVPDMLPEAHRWIAEMEEIAGFAGEDPPDRKIYEGIADLYRRLAQTERTTERKPAGWPSSSGPDPPPRTRVRTRAIAALATPKQYSARGRRQHGRTALPDGSGRACVAEHQGQPSPRPSRRRNPRLPSKAMDRRTRRPPGHQA